MKIKKMNRFLKKVRGLSLRVFNLFEFLWKILSMLIMLQYQKILWEN